MLPQQQPDARGGGQAEQYAVQGVQAQERVGGWRWCSRHGVFVLRIRCNSKVFVTPVRLNCPCCLFEIAYFRGLKFSA
jgi:hypothetical protein